MQKYLVGEGYAASAIYSDFSELRDDNREKAGTIRIVYKVVSLNAEQKVTNELKQKFSSEFAGSLKVSMRAPALICKFSFSELTRALAEQRSIINQKSRVPPSATGS